MQANVKKDNNSRTFIKYVFPVIILITGILLGVIFCNWQYFIIDEKIHIHEIVSVLITSAVGVYIGSNLQKALVRSQYGHEVLFDEIKRIMNSLEKFEQWIDDKKVPFEESKKLFKKISGSIKYCQEVFSESAVMDSDAFKIAIDNFNKLKQELTLISPIAGYIILDVAQADDFDKKYSDIRKEFLRILVR